MMWRIMQIEGIVINWVFLHFVPVFRPFAFSQNSIILSSDSRERRFLVYLGLIDGMFA